MVSPKLKTVRPKLKNGESATQNGESKIQNGESKLYVWNAPQKNNPAVEADTWTPNQKPVPDPARDPPAQRQKYRFRNHSPPPKDQCIFLSNFNQYSLTKCILISDLI